MNSSYGLLLNQKDILLQRSYFNELVTLIGVQVQHRAPKKDKHYTTYSEIQSIYPLYSVGEMATYFERSSLR